MVSWYVTFSGFIFSFLFPVLYVRSVLKPYTESGRFKGFTVTTTEQLRAQITVTVTDKSVLLVCIQSTYEYIFSLVSYLRSTLKCFYWNISRHLQFILIKNKTAQGFVTHNRQHYAFFPPKANFLTLGKKKKTKVLYITFKLTESHLSNGVQKLVVRVHDDAEQQDQAESVGDTVCHVWCCIWQ